MKLFRYPSKINVSSGVVNLLKIYTNFDHEVGGAIFGQNHTSKINLTSLSIKHGSISQISFDNRDKQIFHTPFGTILVGTWHLHPKALKPIPSTKDLLQWSLWGDKYIHIIISESEYNIYLFDGRLICSGEL